MDRPEQIGYWVVTGVALVSSLFVTLSVASFGARTVSSRLVLILHLSLLLELVSQSPDIYVHNQNLCQIMAALKIFGQLLNLMVGVFMALLAHHLIFSVDYDWMNTRSFYSMLVILPLILSFLPIIQDSYQVVHHTWCTFGGVGAAENWFYAIFSLYYVLIGIALLIFIVIICKLSRFDWPLLQSVFSGVGFYSLVTLFCWIPKIFILGNSTSEEYFISRLACSISGVLYTCIFLLQKKSLVMFEYFMRQQMLMDGGGGGDSRSSSLSSYQDSLYQIPMSSRDDLKRGFASGDDGNDGNIEYRESTFNIL